MFLRNYDNITILRHLSNNMNEYYNANYAWHINGLAIFGDGYINVKRTNGAIDSYRGGDYKPEYTTYLTNLTSGNICIGTGVTPVTYDDFTLSGDILDNTKLNYVSNNVEYDASNRKFTKTATYTYTNETDSTITVSEWGIFNYTYFKGGSTPFIFQSSPYEILLYREVLETPIVIEPGISATLKFKVDVPLSNHP